jgi:Tfp pilus assembly protein PilO
MKRNEQMILVGLVAVGLAVAFWLLVISPKRNEASQLQDQVDQLNASLSQAQQDVAAGEQARKGFRIDYRRLVVLGKAVPADGEQGSLLVQLQKLADRSGVSFETMDLSTASASASAPPPTTSTSTTSTDSSSTSTTSSTSTDSSSTSSDPSTTATTAPVAATEASASMLPIGASVGPAGLPVMPYDLSFKGGFFQIADFMKRLDGMVHLRHGVADVSGRLLTVDGFTLTPSDTALTPTPVLTANLTVTTYLTPPDQGITGGATPAGPGATTPTLASSSTTAPSTSTATPTATSTTP